MKGKRKRKPIAHRVIAFVLAFAMVFTSISFSDLGTKEAKADSTTDIGYSWVEPTTSEGDVDTNATYKYLDILDGEITALELYNSLYEKRDFFGTPIPTKSESKQISVTTPLGKIPIGNPSTEGGYQLTHDDVELIVAADDNIDISLNNNVDYSVKHATTSVSQKEYDAGRLGKYAYDWVTYGYSENQTGVSLKTRFYSYPTVSIPTDNIPLDKPEDLTLSCSVSGEKVYWGEEETVTVTNIPGYTAIVTTGDTGLQVAANENGVAKITITSKKDAALTVSYEAWPTVDVDVTVSDGGTLTGAILADGKYTAQENNAYAIKATPNDGYYLDSIIWYEDSEEKQTFNTGHSSTDRSISATVSLAEGKTYKLNVNFEKQSVVDGSLEVVFQESVDSKSDVVLKQRIIDAIIGDGSVPTADTWKNSDYSVQYESVSSITSNKTWRELEWTASGLEGAYSEFPTSAGSTVKVKITYPGSEIYDDMSIEKTIKIVDSRTSADVTTKPATGTYNGTDYYEIPMNGFYSAAELDADNNSLSQAIYDAIVQTSNHNGTWNVLAYDGGSYEITSKGWADLSEYDDAAALTTEFVADSYQSIRIVWDATATYPAYTLEKQIYLKETRGNLAISGTYADTLYPVEGKDSNEDGTLDIDEQIKAAAIAKAQTLYANGSFSVTGFDISAVNKNTVTNVEVSVKLAGDATYKESTGKIIVPVKYFLDTDNDNVDDTLEYTAYWYDGVNTENPFFTKALVAKNSDGTFENHAYTGANPVKADTAQYDYEFDKWSDAVVDHNNKTITYTATYTETTQKYTIKWFDEDGTTVLDEQLLEYGTDPEYKGNTPSKADTAQYTYTFDGWNEANVTGPATYTASYTANIRSYTITWYDEDGTTVLDQQVLEYGKTPVYSKGTPTKPDSSDGQYTYTFKGWSPTVTSVEGNAQYVAEYTTATEFYKVLFTGEGMADYSVTVEPGEKVAYYNATRDGYRLNGWKLNDSTYVFDTPVTTDITLIADWVKQYVFVFNENGGSVVSDIVGDAGSVVAIPETTYKYHILLHWISGTTEFAAKQDVTLNADMEFTAVWGDDKNENGKHDADEYRTIIYKETEDGTVLKTYTDALDGLDTPTINNPTREGFIFDKWNPAVSEKVSGNATYVADWIVDTNKNNVPDVDETVKINIVGTGTVTINNETVSNEQNYLFNSNGVDTLSVVANPSGNYYVDSVAATNGTVSNGTYSGTEYTCNVDATAKTITITFKAYSIQPQTTVELPINDYKASLAHAASYYSYGSELEAAILSALGINVDGTTVKVFVQTNNIGWQNIKLGYGALNAGTEKIQITVPAHDKYPQIIEEVEIKFIEERDSISAVHNVNTYSKDSVAEVEEAIFANLTIAGMAVTDYENTYKVDVTVSAVDATQFPAEGAIKNFMEFEVTAGETVDYLALDDVVKVSVVNTQHPTTVTIKDVEGATITISGLIAGTAITGDYVVTVTPDTENGYYVDQITLDGVGETKDDADYGANGVYTQTVTITNSDTESTALTVDAVVGQRVLPKNSTITNVYMNQALSYENQEERILEDVYKAVVDLSKAVGIDYATDIEVKPLTTVTTIGEYTFQITWKGSRDNHYPDVVITEKVNLVDDLEPIVINPTITAIEGVDAYTKEDIIDAVKTNLADDVDYELVVGDMPALIQGENVYVDVTIKVQASATFEANTKTVQVPVTGDVNDASVTITTAVGGTLDVQKQSDIATASVVTTYEAGKYIVTLTPSEGYFIDKLDVTLDGTTTTYAYDKFDANGQLVLDIIDGTGKAIDYVPTYTLTAMFIKPAVVIEDSTVNYQGEREAELPGLIWNEVFVSANPTDLVANAELDVDPKTTIQEVNDLTVYYKAREAATYTETITVKLPVVGNYTFTADIPVGDQWLEISQEVPVGAGMPTQDEIQAIVDELLEEYDWQELMNMGIDGLKDLAKTELEGVYEEYYRFYNAHTFGMTLGTTETVKVVYNSERFGAVESEEAVVTLADTRPATEIKLNTGVEMTYGFTEDELTAALLDGVYADGKKINGATIQYVTKVNGLNASEEAYTIKVLYDGGKQYKHSTAETTIIVKKAPVDVKVDNRLIKWKEGLTYDMPVVTDPAGVDTINFIVGLNVSDINVDDNSIKGIMGEVQLMIPDSLQGILDSVGIKNGVSMTIAELQEKLTAVSEALGWANSENAIVTTLLNMLNSLPTETADLTVRIGGQMPTDIGVYLVGAVSADGNYETNAGVGIVAITPDGKKAELDWAMDDDNSIITRTLLTSGAFDTSAKVTSVAEGSIEEAQSQVVELFLGVDIDGNIKLETDQTKLNVGAYTEVAMIVNWGNEFYYSAPIARAFVVIAESLDLKFIDETGAENAERHFIFDNTAKTMEDVVVTYKDGGATILNTVTGEKSDVHQDGNLKFYYVGAQTNVNPYLSTEPPVHAGAYTVTAVYTLRDADGMVSHAGLNVGAMVIEPAESDTVVDNGYYMYEKGTSHTVTDLVTATSTVEGLTPDTTVISAGITTDGTFSENAFDAVVGTVNVDMPTWLDELFVKYNLFEAGYTEEGISAATFLVYLEKAEAILAELNIEVDTITQLKDTVVQMSDNTTLTFADDVAYENIGAYLVVGVVTDSDHYPSVGAGLMVIYPDATEVDLEWNEDDWNNNNLFTWNHFQSMDVDASAFDKDTTVKNEEASAMVDNFFLGVTDDGQILLTSDKAVLDVGAYTQFAYLLDLDSVMYYAKPIARPFVIIPNIADITFVDETGAENADRHFVYDCEAHEMKAIVTVDGEVVAQTGDADLTVTYAGVQSNGKVYNSTEAPSHTGTYAVTAIYTMTDDQGRRVTVGMEVGAMVIEAAQSTMDVDNVARPYDGQPYNTADMITATSAANDPDLDTTVITASLATNGNFSEVGLGAIEGAVNVDLPDYVDAVTKQISALEAGYTGNGLAASDFIAILERYEEELSTIQMTKEIYDGLMNILVQLPADVKVTFKEQADVAPYAVGAYLVIGMVTDTNHYPSMDAGVLVIYPTAEEATLDWRYDDTNNIYTLDTLDIIDLGVDAYVADVKNDELTEKAETLFIGVDAENWKITLTDKQSDLATGFYTEMAFLLTIDSTSYYAEPISRPVIVVPNTYKVDFVDETGAVNNDRLFTFDNTAKSMDNVVVTDVNGNVIDTTNGTLTITYVGNDVTPGIYYGGEAPTHVGAYTVTATFVGRDADGDLQVGAGIGAMVIQPADATVNVNSQVVLEGEDYTIGVTATAADYVVNDTPKTLTILAGVDMDEYNEKGVFALDGVVNVDFPEAVDNVLKEIYPDWYTVGIGTDAFFAEYDKAVAAVAEAGFDTTLFTDLKVMLEELNAANLTFKETEEAKPTATGVYAILAMVFDPDYITDVDTALLVISPDATVAEIEFNMAIPGMMNIIPYEVVDQLDFGAHVTNFVSTDPDKTTEDILVKDVIFGLTTDFEIFIGSSEDKPDELGVYDQVAYAETGSDFAIVLPELRTFTVVKSTANVEFYDGEQYVNPTPNWLRTFVYDGKPQEMPARLTLIGGEVVKDANGNNIKPNVWYLGVENDIVFYSSDVPPTDVGAYQVIGYYFSEEENIYTVGLGAMTITQREVTITVDDKSMVVNEAMPELTYTVTEGSIANAAPLDIKVVSTTDGTMVGEFMLGATVSDNPNYKVTVVPGTLTVAIAENVWTEEFGIEGWTYGDTPNGPTGESKFGTVEFVYTGTTAAGVAYNSTEVPTQAGEYTLTATVEGTDDYTGLTASTDFAIAKKDVTITVEDQTMVYGASEPDYTSTIDGLVAPDTLEIGDYNRKTGNKVGTYWIDVEYTPNSNYDVTVEKGTLTITKAPLTVTVEDATKVYGEANPEFTLGYDGFKHGDNAADLGGTATFTCTATTTSSVGTYDITVEGLTSGNYDITYKAGTLTINPAALPAAEAIAAQTYTGSALTPAVVIDGLTAGTDYTVAYADNTAAGEATVTITGKGNYTGSQTVKFTINPAALPAPEAIAAQTYTGSALTPAVVIDGLTEGTDYIVAYADNTAAGEATVTITGKGNYTGSQTVKFTINPAALPAPEAIAAQTYTGSALTPAVVINGLTEGTDYTVAYADNTAAGEATVTITGKGNYTGTQTVKFTINPKSASTLTTEAIANQTYTGNAITPTVVVKDGDKVLTEGTDYTVSYTNNTKPGTATITITGIGNYDGTTTATFTIAKTIDQVIAELSLVDIEVSGQGSNSMYIRGFTVGETTESLKARLSNIEGATLKSFVNEANAQTVATGMEFTLTINGVDYHRIIVVMGDTNGDGNIWATDYTLIKNQIMTEKVLLVKEYRIAADINRDDNIYATDYTAIKNYIMNDVEIDQSGAISQ